MKLSNLSQLSLQSWRLHLAQNIYIYPRPVVATFFMVLANGYRRSLGHTVFRSLAVVYSYDILVIQPCVAICKIMAKIVTIQHYLRCDSINFNRNGIFKRSWENSNGWPRQLFYMRCWQ